MKLLQSYLASVGLPPMPPEGEEKLLHYAARLCEENEKYNLTAITDPEGIELRHFADSLTPALWIPQGSLRMIDVGCGAGFPGLPLKIYLDCLCPGSCTLTMLDATGKKAEFLSNLCAELGVSGTEAVQARAEEFARLPDRRERYDVALSRAVASMDKLDELCLPFLRVGGAFLALKSSAGRDECAAAQRGIEKLGGGTPEFLPYRIAPGQPESLLVRIPKRRETPEAYPRAFGAIKKRPL